MIRVPEFRRSRSPGPEFRLDAQFPSDRASYSYAASVANDRTQQILDEFKALRKEMEERLESFEARLDSTAGIGPEAANEGIDDAKPVPEKSAPEPAEGDPVSASATAEADPAADEPLDPAAETADGPAPEAAAEIPINALPKDAGTPDEPASTAPVVTADQVASGQVPSRSDEGAEEVDASIGAGSVDVVLAPLLDISLARAVESALNGSDEILRAALREVRSDAAVIDTAVKPGVSVVAVLRSRLPVSFKVVESDSGSVTIALAQPLNGTGDDSAVPEVK